ncbi:DUF58 domain-containing protein [Cohnella faecalis]|uniref:DUF58 domain-containing protein n=2 Tax=Cohnella faecalis TaxID=2315694 RepID=A0A398CP51_9BACL|nr:DUF58 domain-containing protein [Cohnella faecalis]
MLDERYIRAFRAPGLLRAAGRCHRHASYYRVEGMAAVSPFGQRNVSADVFLALGQGDDANRRSAGIHPRDRFSRIHWNATAKTGQWKSKEYEREALPRVVFVLDRNAASYRTPELFELALSTAASLVELSQQKGMQIGFVSAGRIASYFGSGHAGYRARRCCTIWSMPKRTARRN